MGECVLVRYHSRALSHVEWVWRGHDTSPPGVWVLEVSNLGANVAEKCSTTTTKKEKVTTNT